MVKSRLDEQRLILNQRINKCALAQNLSICTKGYGELCVRFDECKVVGLEIVNSSHFADKKEDTDN
jgi:hypothetical protein